MYYLGSSKQNSSQIGTAGNSGGMKKLQNELRRQKANESNEVDSNGQRTFSRIINDKIDQRTQIPIIHKKQQSIIQEETSSQNEGGGGGSSHRMKESRASQPTLMKGINQQSEQPMTARTNKSHLEENQQISSNASVKGKQQYQRQSTFSSDGISGIRPLKSTTSAHQLLMKSHQQRQTADFTSHTTPNVRGGNETTRDFLMSEDLNNYSENERIIVQKSANYRGMESVAISSDDDNYDNEDDEDDSDDDDNASQISNPLKDYQEDKHSHGHSCLFIDPDSFLYYRKDVKRNDYIILEPFYDETLKKEFEEKNRIHLYKIRKLLLLDGFSWNFKGEADLYRRRHFPKQFLQNEASDYPCYVFNSELSKAFNHKGDIETIVDITEYSELLKQNQHSKEGGSDDQIYFDIAFKESLVTSTKEFIKNILRKVYEKYKVKLKPQLNCNLILKASGYREYFEGNYQLLQYERVRACLRKNEAMKLILTEIPMNYRDKKFPPIFRNKYEVPTIDGVVTSPQNNQVMNQSMQSALQHSQVTERDPNQAFKFKSLKNSSPFFWYPPVANLKSLYDRMEKNSAKLQKNTNNSSMANQADRNFLRRVVYVAPDKDLMSLTDQREKMGGTTIPKQTQQIIMHSGECNWRFKFKLVGIERLNVLFNEIRNRVATDNKSTEPRNVTLKAQKVQTKRAMKGDGVKKGQEGEVPSSSADNMTNLSMRTMSVVQPEDLSPNKSIVTQISQQQQPIADKSKSKQGGFLSKMFTKQPSKESLSSPKGSQRKKSLPSSRSGGDVPKKKSKKSQVNDDENWLIQATEVPTIIKQAMKMYQPAKKTEEEKKEEDKAKKKKKKGGHGHGGILHLNQIQEAYIDKELTMIHTPFCNFSNKYDTIQHYHNILSVLFGKMTPLKLQVECTLYHGCEVLTQGVFSDEAYFGNTIHFDQWINFGNLRYCQIPMKTRLSFNLNLLTKEAQMLTIGCVSMNLFDEKGRFKNGMRELNVWPFYELDERLGCMKEYNGMTVEQTQAKDFFRTIDTLFTKVVVEFESFITPLFYSSRDEKRIEQFKLSTNKEDVQDKENLINVQIKNQDLAQLKKYLNCNPLSKIDEQVKRDLFKCREHYQTHPQGLPIFLRSVQWNRPIQVNEVYKMLQNWAPMKPEEAISLLDAKFPDERVRQYAVQRISQLSDDDLALYMLQFAQALLYEEQHNSPLAEMLIERSLKNPYVVGHAFFWGLKSNLYLKVSYERYYVLLEQFLMLCGKFKEDIWIQQKTNLAFKAVSESVVHNCYTEKIEFDSVKVEARHELRRQRKNLPLLFTLPIDPKIVIRDFRYDLGTVFGSKKVPLCLWGLNQQPGGKELQFLFKNGDDLRQDILTLQIIYIMDKMWLANNLDLAMTPYKVLGTDCEQGYLEFVQNSDTIAYIQYHESVFKTFSDNTIEKFMTDYMQKNHFDDWKDRLEKARNTFIRSTAGYCVASYVLGLGDRHPDNIMINKERGNFFHIDFGHFLGNVKKKFGVKRERDPFVFSKEIAYFVNGGPLNKRNNSIKLNKKLTEDEHRDLSESIMTGEDYSGFTQNFALDDQNPNIGGGISQDDSDFVDETMKSKNFREFEDMCCQAYNILRSKGHQLINMFLIMLSAGMPELKEEDDLQYLVNRLDLNISEQEASNKFKKEIQRAMNTYSRRFDNFIHNIKQKTK